MMITTHHGQHDDDCFGCKLLSITLDTGAAKTHLKKGDPWEGNPVAERIEELKAEGRRVESAVLTNPNAPKE